MTDYLIHYGVKGMKWGIRHDPNDTSKYYTNGRLNRRGKIAKRNAMAIRGYHKMSPGQKGYYYGTMAVSAAISYHMARTGSEAIHALGNKRITDMKMRGASYNKRKAVAGAYIAGMGALKVAAIYPYARAGYQNTRYKFDENYRNRIDERANLTVRQKKI